MLEMQGKYSVLIVLSNLVQELNWYVHIMTMVYTSKMGNISVKHLGENVVEKLTSEFKGTITVPTLTTTLPSLLFTITCL